MAMFWIRSRRLRRALSSMGCASSLVRSNGSVGKWPGTPNGQGQPYGGARALVGCQADGAVVTQNDLTGDGQTQAGASGFPGAGLIHPVKTFKDPVAVFFRDTDAVVAYFHPYFRFRGSGGNDDVAAVGSVLDGIAENVHHDLLQTAAVAYDQGEALRRLIGQGMETLLGSQSIGTDNASMASPEGEAGEHQLGVACVQPAQGQQVLNDMGHSICFCDDDIQETVGGIPGDVAAVPQGLGVAADIGQRRTQLMGHVGNEFLSALLIAVLLRHIVKDDQHAAAGLIREGGQVQFKCTVSDHHLTFGVVGTLKGQHLLEGVDAAKELIIGTVRGNGPLQHGGGGGVAVDQGAIVVKSHHAVGHMEKQRVQLVSLVFHGGQSGLQHPGHLIEGAGQNADLVSGFHGQPAVKISGSHLLRAGGQLSIGPTMVLDNRKLSSTEISSPMISACMMMRNS